MTNEQINIAIAEACGWKCSGHPDQLAATKGWEFGHQFVIRPDGQLVTHGSLPDYCNNLNAMHEAEKTLHNDFYFAVKLYHLLIPQEDQYDDHTITWSIANKLIKATARQRAEALLRTIGKWEGGK